MVPLLLLLLSPVCVCAPVQDVEVAVPVAQRSRAWCGCMCLGLALMLSGLVIGGVYLYHHHVLEDRVQVSCYHGNRCVPCWRQPPSDVDWEVTSLTSLV